MMDTNKTNQIDYSMLPLDAVIRGQEVELITSYKRESLRKAVIAGEFPPPRKIGPRLNGWRLGDVLAWCRGEWTNTGNETS